MGDTELVVIRTFSNKFDADVAKSALDAADIDSMIKADDADGMYPGMAFANGVDLLVRREDAERAAEILEPES